MILDAQNEFSNAQAVTATAISTNVIDLGLAASDIGAGEPVYLVILTNTAVTSSTSAATLTATLESDSTADLATSATTHFSTGSIAFAGFSPAGTVVAAVALPIGEYERHLGVRYTIGTENLTAGAFDAFLTKDVGKYRTYANNYDV